MSTALTVWITWSGRKQGENLHFTPNQRTLKRKVVACELNTAGSNLLAEGQEGNLKSHFLLSLQSGDTTFN